MVYHINESQFQSFITYLIFTKYNQPQLYLLQQIMFYLPDIKKRKSLLHGPLSFDNYNHANFQKLTNSFITNPKSNTNHNTFNSKFTNQYIPPINSSRSHYNTIDVLNHRKQIKAQQQNNLEASKSRDKKIKLLPYIQVFLGDLIFSERDMIQKHIKIDLQKYFEIFFKKSLKGELWSQFYRKIEYYIGKMNEEFKKGQLNKQYLKIGSKQQFLKLIQQLQNKNDEYQIIYLIKYFCVPEKQFRQQTIKDLKLLLKKQIKLQFQSQIKNMPNINQFQLYTNKKVLVQDLIQIPFHQLSLIFCHPIGIKETFNRIKSIQQKRIIRNQKQTFLHNIKSNFRDKIKRINEMEKPMQLKLATTNRDRKGQLMNTKRSVNQDIIDKKVNKLSDPQIKQDRKWKMYEQLQQGVNTVNLIGLCQRLKYLRHLDKDTKLRVLKSFEGLKNKSLQQKITYDQFCQVIRVIQCKQSDPQIIKFLQNLIFQKSDEMDLKGLKEQLMSFLILYNDETAPSLMINLIWKWFLKNYMITSENDKQLLTQQKFANKYLNNTKIYHFLISIIFATSKISPIDITLDITL